MKLNWGTWLYGLVSGFIGGGASAVTASIVLPAVDGKDFNFATGLHNLALVAGALFIVHGGMTAAAYLAKSPLPSVETTVTVATTTQVGEAPKVTTTVSATTQDTKPIAPQGS